MLRVWCWRRLLRVPWTARRSNQSILKEISPGCSLEGLMLKLNSNPLASWCEELIHWKRPWCWEWLGAGGEGDDRGWDGWMASLTRWAWVWVNTRCWWWPGRPGVPRFMGLQRVGHDWVTELNWTELKGCLGIEEGGTISLCPGLSHSCGWDQRWARGCDKWHKTICCRKERIKCLSCLHSIHCGSESPDTW